MSQDQDFSAIREALDEAEPTWWRPEPGDEMVGVVEAFDDSAVGQFGPSPAATVRTDDGSLLSIRFAPAVLRRYAAELEPRPGDEIGVRFIGEATSKSGTRFKDYRVALRRDGQLVRRAGRLGPVVAVGEDDPSDRDVDRRIANEPPNWPAEDAASF